MLAPPLLTGAQLCRARDDACLEFLVELANLFLGALPLGDVLTDSDDAEGLVSGATERPDIPQHDALLAPTGANPAPKPWTGPPGSIRWIMAATSARRSTGWNNSR